MTKTKTKMRMKTTTTSILRRVLIVSLLAGSALVLPAAKRAKKPAAPATAAIFAGTVFGGAGFSLRGAEVVVTRDGAGTPGAEKSKESRWKATSDARGEFFLRLPAGPAKYNVSVRAPGMKPQEKQVNFEADERQELNFLLEPDAGGGK